MVSKMELNVEHIILVKIINYHSSVLPETTLRAEMDGP